MSNNSGGTERRLQLTFSSALILLALVSGLFVWSRERLSDDRLAVEQSYQVVLSLEDIFSTIKDAENGQRGYLITGDPTYLDPYHNALDSLSAKVVLLDQLTEDNPNQQAAINDLQDLITQKRNELQETIDLRQSSGFDAAAQLVMTDQGRNLMDRIRHLIDDLESAERTRLLNRQQITHNTSRTADWIALAGMVLSFGLLASAFLWLSRELRFRRQAELAVREVNTTLEQRVADRTYALSTANQSLEAEIEERKLAQDAEHRQREWLQTTLTSIGDAVIATDNQGHVTFLNPIAQQLTGWTEAEAIGQDIATVFNIVNESTRQPIESPVTKVLREGNIVGLANHTVLMTKDGREIPIDDSGAPIRDAQGQITGVILVFRDITERVRFEKDRETLALQVQQSAKRAIRLQDITAAFSGALTLADIATIVVNLARQEIGAAAASVVRLIDGETLEVVDAANYEQQTIKAWQNFSVNTNVALAETVRTSTPLWIESRHEWETRYHKPGLPDHNKWATLPLIVNGTPLGAIGLSFKEPRSFSDDDKGFMMALAAQCAQAMDRAMIYEAEQASHKEAEKAKLRLEFIAKASRLLASSLEYDVTFNNLRSLILPDLADLFTIDVIQSDNLNGKTLQRVVTGAIDPQLEYLAKEVDRLYPPNLDRILAAPAIQAGQPILFADITPAQVEAVAHDETHLDMLRKMDITTEILMPIYVRDTPIGILTVERCGSHPHYNMDDVVMIQELAHRAAQAIDNARLFMELRQAVRLRDEFLSIAAHELKTPVTSMRGFAQTILRKIGKHGSIDIPQLENGLRVIDQQSIKLTKLIGQLLDIARLEAGRLTLDRQQTDIMSIIRDVGRQFQGMTTKHTIAVEGPETVQLHVDAGRLEQVIVNLVDNAVKYSPNGGDINVSVSQPDSDTVQLVVQDNGMGIPLERRQYLFDRFYQAHSEGHYGGMGLGLYISRQIVELHGGQIRAEFPERRGTCFIITLPA